MPCFLHNLYKSSGSYSYKQIGTKFSYSYGSGSVTGFYSEDLLQIEDLNVKINFGEATGFQGAT